MDMNWPATTVLASLLWTIGFALAVGDLLTPADTGPLGMVIAAAAATLNVRKWIADSSRRERTAFQLGQDDGKSSLRPIP